MQRKKSDLYPDNLIGCLNEINGIVTRSSDDSEEKNYVFTKEKINNGIWYLPERERRILNLYYKEYLTCDSIGKIFGITRSRIAQIRNKAEWRLYRVIKAIDSPNSVFLLNLECAEELIKNGILDYNELAFMKPSALKKLDNIGNKKVNEILLHPELNRIRGEADLKDVGVGTLTCRILEENDCYKVKDVAPFSLEELKSLYRMNDTKAEKVYNNKIISMVRAVLTA